LDATPIRDHDDLVALVRRRQDELGVACVTIDQIAGVPDGYFSKLMCGIKRFGPISIFLVLAALGLRIRIEEDPDAIAKLRRRWLPRDERYAANAYKRGEQRDRSPWGRYTTIVGGGRANCI
jgi:hypothetical protein